MALTPGTRLGVYEVSAKIGEGGMGEVYPRQRLAIGMNRCVTSCVCRASPTRRSDRACRSGPLLEAFANLAAQTLQEGQQGTLFFRSERQPS